jgi:uncharacterized protein YbjT (DUF2867 family)
MGAMAREELDIVTGAFGYSGRYITERLLEAGCRVKTLTGSPQRANPFGGRVQALPYRWDDPRAMAKDMLGATVLYNTYWIRFETRKMKFDQAVQNTKILFAAAKAAGIRRIVHVSIANPAMDARYPYFKGKAQCEKLLAESGISHAILRPAVLFGGEGILINNIAWALRRLPVFAVFGSGRYRLRPIHVDDFARLAIGQARASDTRTLDAVGPESFTYRELVEAVGGAIGKRRPLVSVPASLAIPAAWLIGKLKRDVLLTRHEVRALMANLLSSPAPATGGTRLTDWLRENAQTLGVRYAGELVRRRNRTKSYDQLLDSKP